MNDIPTTPFPYLYKPFHNAVNEIRLLQLHSRHWNPPGDNSIRCSLVHTSLSEVGSSEALSYAWGDATNQKTIQVNGRPFQVTNNLYIALHHLRRENEVRCMWIDAICINQDDLDECSSQVAQMQRVYRGAKRMVVFLGETWSEREAVMDTMILGSKYNPLHYDPSLGPHLADHETEMGPNRFCKNVSAFLSSS